MKILSFERNGGDLRATILCEASDRGRFGGVRETVEGCIRLFAEEKGLPQPALPRVTRMDETADGGLEFDFDAAVPPVVELGQYLGLEVYVPSDEAPDLHVLRTAAERMKVEIPETYISRKTDGLMGQRLEDVAQRTGFVTLADMAAILRRVDAALALGRSDDELWDAAVAAADEMSGAQLRAHSSPRPSSARGRRTETARSKTRCGSGRRKSSAQIPKRLRKSASPAICAWPGRRRRACAPSSAPMRPSSSASTC